MSTQQPGAAEAVSTPATAPARPASAEQTSGLEEPVSAELGYTAAMAELEQILEALEEEDPDVDMLAARVERASELIEICRGRIRNASIQVERVIAALEPDAAS